LDVIYIFVIDIIQDMKINEKFNFQDYTQIIKVAVVGYQTISLQILMNIL